MIGRAGRKANVKLFEDRISSTVARVRIALALKGLTIETDEVSILGVKCANPDVGISASESSGTRTIASDR
jgi:hypothetical protein